jgi:hypothetical protein
LTGYNHYPSCTCGWCVNYGRTRVNRSAVNAEYLRHEAKSFLEKNSARSVAGCYVNPNARCPVCRKPVFFYANEIGSRVYFDSLGGDWPKHPCTDNPRRAITTHAVFSGGPTRRAHGITHELLEAARVSGDFPPSSLGSGGWSLLIVISVDRRGTRNDIEAEFLDADGNRRARFTCHSDESVFELGDFVSKKGKVFSFLHKATLSTLSLSDGDWVRAPVKQAAKPPTPPPIEPSAPQSGVKQPIEPRQRSFDMTRQEMGHFHSKKVTVEQLCDRLMPIVRAYARAGIRKPRDVAVRLNLDGHRTLMGAKWTPRLTYFLLALIFLEPAKSKKTAPTGRSSPGHGASEESDGVLTPESIAKRLSRLGRVSIRSA